MAVKKQMPTGVKVIAVLNYIGAGLLALLAIVSLFGAGMMSSLLENEFGLLGMLGGGIFIVFAIILLAFAILSFFIGRGLWIGQQWARIISIVFAGLGVLFALIAIIGGEIIGNLFSLVVNGIIGGYLFFNKEVKAAFA